MEIETSPIKKLSAQAAVDPEGFAAAALACVNGSASRNTYLTLDADWTRDQAAQVATQGPNAEKLLYGLPVALKDCFDLEGFVTSAGSRFYASHNVPAMSD